MNQRNLGNQFLRSKNMKEDYDNGKIGKRFSSEQPRSAQNIEKMYVSGVFGGLPEYKEIMNEDQ